MKEGHTDLLGGPAIAAEGVLSDPIPTRERKPKKTGFIVLISAVGGFALLALVYVFMLIQEQTRLAAKTPLPEHPVSTLNPHEIQAPSKVEQYEMELKTRKKREKEAMREAERMDRISMSWEKIYGKDTDEDIEEVEKDLKKGTPESKDHRYENKTGPYQSSSSQTRPTKIEPYTPKGKGNRSAQSAHIYQRREASDKANQPSFNTLSLSPRKRSSMSLAKVGAVIDGDQKIRAGQYIKFRLTERLKLPHGEILDTHTSLMGLCSFGNGRIKAEIKYMLSEESPTWIKLRVLDTDLIEGIAYNDPRIKEAESREMERVGGDVYDELLSEVPYAGAFINAGRNIAKNKSRAKARKVSLSDNYRVILELYQNESP